MKALLLYVAIFALLLFLLPMTAMNFGIAPASNVQVHSPAMSQQSAAPPPEASGAAGVVVAAEEPDPAEPEGEELPTALPADVQGAESFRILDETTGQVAEVPLRDFVRGAVAAEMPASFHPEALKAQAVAAHTYALHNRLVQQEAPDPELKGADFSADPGNFKVYITEAQAREFYGGMADVYWSKICAAADSVLAYILEYDEQPIVAAYHAISAGQTEDAANVWSGSAPYLLAADSGGDLLAADYESEVVLPDDELRERLTAAYPGIALPDDPGEWFGEPVRSGSGYVTEIEVGDRTLHGKEIRQLLDLRSHNFEVDYTGGNFVFHVYGYGHGVGLSQNGSDYMARQGASFDEILAHYYNGAALKQLVV